MDSSAINGPTEQNTVYYIERQLETYLSWNWDEGLSFEQEILINLKQNVCFMEFNVSPTPKRIIMETGTEIPGGGGGGGYT